MVGWDTTSGRERVDRLERVEVWGGVGGSSGVSDPLEDLEAMINVHDKIQKITTKQNKSLVNKLVVNKEQGKLTVGNTWKHS